MCVELLCNVSLSYINLFYCFIAAQFDNEIYEIQALFFLFPKSFSYCGLVKLNLS